MSVGRIAKRKKNIQHIKKVMLFVLIVTFTYGAIFLFLLKEDDIKSEITSSISVITNPRLKGADNKDSFFEINASKGVQDSGAHILFQEIEGKMKSKNDINVSAKHGDLFLEEKEIELNGNVVFGGDGKYTIKTEQASIAYDGKSAKGRKPVSLESESRDQKINASNFQILENSAQIEFDGGAHAQLTIENNGSKKNGNKAD